MPRSIHFGVFLLGTGNHTAGWRYPGADQTFLDIRVLQRVAAIAERGLFDFLFLGDGLVANLGNHPSYTCRLEPMTLLSALAMTTTHVGLAATMSTTYSDPYTVARISHRWITSAAAGRPGTQSRPRRPAPAATSAARTRTTSGVTRSRKSSSTWCSACGIAGATRPSLPIS